MKKTIITAATLIALTVQSAWADVLISCAAAGGDGGRGAGFLNVVMPKFPDAGAPPAAGAHLDRCSVEGSNSNGTRSLASSCMREDATAALSRTPYSDGSEELELDVCMPEVCIVLKRPAGGGKAAQLPSLNMTRQWADAKRTDEMHKVGIFSSGHCFVYSLFDSNAVLW